MTKKPESILILTSSGGGGLLQLAKSFEQNFMESHPGTQIVICDVLKEWSWLGFGNFFVWLYNRLQKWGWVKLLEWVVSCQPYAEKLIWIPVFFHMRAVLKKNEFSRIIDTQPLAPSAIIKALRLYNQKHKKMLVLEKMVVDLPTPKATHFFQNIKKLSPTDRKTIILTSAPPLLEKNQSLNAFWQHHCSLPLKQIREIPYFIRKGFTQFIEHSKNEEMEIMIRTHSKEEKNTLYENIFPKRLVRLDQESLYYKIKKEDRLAVILLGSQAAKEATFLYVKNFLQLAKKNLFSTHFFVFVFCPDPKLKEKVQKLIKAKKFKKIHLVPISFQKDDVIAKLFFRADLTITKSGGQTLMELMAVSKGNFFIHSEAKWKRNQKLTDEKLIRGIPAWEAGSAIYLKEKYGAKMITPELLSNYREEIFQKS